MLRMWSRKRKSSEGTVLAGVALGERPWLVLGGGGLKGMAHLGAWRELDEAGFQPSGILGTSIGALVGACVAAGISVEELEEAARALQRSDIATLQRRALWLNGIRSPALFRGDRLKRYLERRLPEGGWDALSTRFQTNAVELGSGRTEWFGIGARTDVSLPEAVYASSALPLFYPPIVLPGGIYIDGGTEEALPIRRAAELGATGIVAVDVGSAEGADAEDVIEGGMLSIHGRVFSIMSGRIRRETVDRWNGPPLLYIRPKLDAYGTFDFDHVDEFLQAGLEAVTNVLRPTVAAESG